MTVTPKIGSAVPSTKVLTVLFAAMGVIVVGAVGYVLYQGLAPDSGLNQWRAACEQAGGVPLTIYKTGSYCIKRDALINP